MDNMAKYAPYADWDKARKRKPSNFRYRSMTGIAKADEYTQNGTTPDKCLEFLTAREKARQRIEELVTDPNSMDYVHRKSGCPKSLLSHMKVGRRTFCVPMKCWESLSYDVMHISIQNLIFGEDRDITLPRKYALPAAYMAELMTQEEIKRFAKISDKLVERYHAAYPDDFGHHRSVADLVHERITEIKDQFGFYNYQIFGAEETPNCMKPNLAAFWDKDRNSELKYNFLCYAALYYRDQGIDYIVAEDPLRGYSDAYGVSKDGKRVLLTGDLKQYWRNVIRLDGAGKQQLLEMAWSAIYSKLLSPTN